MKPEELTEIVKYTDKVNAQLEAMGFDDRINHYVNYCNLDPIHFTFFLAEMIAAFHIANKTADDCASAVFTGVESVAAKVFAENPTLPRFDEKVH